jgi:hypothetical protein
MNILSYLNSAFKIFVCTQTHTLGLNYKSINIFNWYQRRLHFCFRFISWVWSLSLLWFLFFYYTFLSWISLSYLKKIMILSSLKFLLNWIKLFLQKYLIVQLSESYALIDSLKSENTMLFDIIDTLENKLKESEDLLKKFSNDKEHALYSFRYS